MADDYPIRVGLIACHYQEAKPLDVSNVGSRTIDGRTYVCDLTTADCPALNLVDRGQVLVRHEIYGVCFVRLLPRL